MKRHRLAAVVGAVLLALLGAWGLARTDDRLGPRSERPDLGLITSLPLVFSESFGLERSGSPALSRLGQRYNVVPLAAAEPDSLAGKRLLLMAHPRAQPAELLVALDRWVRDGGRLLLLADPKLEWPSERPFGDRLRPPPGFADTGLLHHWGLQLSGAGMGEVAGQRHCSIEKDGMIARCRIGEGQVTVIADADFLNVESPDSEPLDSLMAELARLERH